jgi:hypothetical protein
VARTSVTRPLVSATSARKMIPKVMATVTMGSG